MSYVWSCFCYIWIGMVECCLMIFNVQAFWVGFDVDCWGMEGPQPATPNWMLQTRNTKWPPGFNALQALWRMPCCRSTSSFGWNPQVTMIAARLCNHPLCLISGYEKAKNRAETTTKTYKNQDPPCAPPALLCCYRRPSAARWRPCARCLRSCRAHPPAPHRRRRAPGPPGCGRPPRSPGSAPRPSAARRPPTSGPGQGPGRCTPGGHRAQRSSSEAGGVIRMCRTWRTWSDVVK